MPNISIKVSYMNIYTKKIKPFFLLFVLIYSHSAKSQVGIGTNTPHPSAQLELISTNKGFLPTRIALTSLTDVTTIPSPANGLLIYNTATAGTSPNNVTPGYYYFNGSKWIRLSVSSIDELDDAIYDSIKLNLGISKYIFKNLTTGVYNIAIGGGSLIQNTSGSNNISIGHASMNYNKAGNFNVCIGNEVSIMSENGSRNVAVGWAALPFGGNNCVAMGNFSGGFGGNENVSIGSGSLATDFSGDRITAVGANTNYYPPPSTQRFRNSTALGYGALIKASNTIQLGNDSITDVMTSGKMRARGYLTNATALTSATDVTTIASPDTGLMVYNKATAGSSPNNVSPGYFYFNGAKWVRLSGATKLDDLDDAIYDSTLFNLGIGTGALAAVTTGSYNTAIGYQANLSTGNLTNATAIGYGAIVNASNTIQLGNTAITNIYTSGNITANSVQLTSDARLKSNIEGIEGGLETLLRLRPYSYQKRSGFEPEYHEEREYGFLAQDIREILPELVKEGNDPDKALTVNYTALIPILTKAIQEQQDTINKQQQQISELKEMIMDREHSKTYSSKKNRKSNK
jgi:hypothetical protein